MIAATTANNSADMGTTRSPGSVPGSRSVWDGAITNKAMTSPFGL
jgi:hypothetical protein